MPADLNCISAISNKGQIRFMIYDERFTGIKYTAEEPFILLLSETN